MLPFFLMLLPIPFPGITTAADDPSPGVLTPKGVSRNLECATLSENEAHERYPGVVSEPAPRGSYINASALACRTRIFSYGERPDREEALLSRLSQAAAEIAAAVDAPELAKATWLVDVFHGDETVSGKISFATKVALASRGRRVSDRLPALASGDVLVLARMAPEKAYPVACSRYWAEGSLAPTDVLLAVVSLDARETVLHAGLCAQGRWRWVQ